MKRILVAVFLLAAVSGCTWVQVTSDGAGVRLANTNEVGDCNRIGRTRSKTLSRIVVVQRGGEKLQEELVSLARNEAADMGGNTIVAESLIDAGEQVFGVYNCPSN